jgi:hypothetical protein
VISVSHFGEEKEDEMAWSPDDPDPGIEPTPEHRDLVKLYLIDEKWNRPTFLFEELSRVLRSA